MTRTITVTGGFTGSVVVDITDSRKQLAAATFRLALVPVGQDDPPPVDGPTWEDAEGEPTVGAASVSIPVTGVQAVGHYNIALDVVSDGNHEAVWVADRGSTSRRALVVVT